MAATSNRRLIPFNYTHSHIVISQLWDIPPRLVLPPRPPLSPSSPIHVLPRSASAPRFWLPVHDAGLARAPQTHTEAGNYTI